MALPCNKLLDGISFTHSYLPPHSKGGVGGGELLKDDRLSLYQSVKEINVPQVRLPMQELAFRVHYIIAKLSST